MMHNDELLAFLQKNNIISEEQIIVLKEKAGDREGELVKILAKEKIIGEEELTQLQAQHYSLPYVDLKEIKIPSEALNVFSSEVSNNYNIICFGRAEKKIKVGIIDPGNFKAIEAIDFLAKGNGFSVEYYLLSRSSFKEAHKRYKSISKEINTALKTHEQEVKAETKKSDKDELQEVTRSAPVVKIVSVIIQHAIEGGASDIHIEPLGKESRVRYRIDGILHTSLVLPINIHNSIVARIKVMANMKLDETRIPQDGRIKIKVNDQGIDFRVSTLPLIGTEKVVMRILYTEKGAPKLTDLGFVGEQLAVVNKCIEQTEGIILITGPTGSGKSTTLFAILELLNKESVNISTLEDPVEYQVKGVSQSQIKPEIGYTFASGLRSFLRQDPDIIMVGEIRDNETAELSIHAALTGHLVLSTLHTTSALGAIARFVDMGVQNFLLGSTLNTIIAQRLVRKICPQCIKKMKIPPETLAEIKDELKNVPLDYIKAIIEDFSWDKAVFYKGEGCTQCGNSGYSGRVCIAEAIDMTEQLKKIIFSGQPLMAENVRDSQNFLSIKQDGLIKVLLGKTSLEEVLRVMRD